MARDLRPFTSLVPGTTVASRFTLEQQAGRGGMGSVYRATVLLAQGRITEAREVIALGVQGLEARGDKTLPAVRVYLAMAEACLAGGDTQAGESALRKALQCVRSRAKDIPDEAARQRFLLQVPENARTLELARQRWGEAEIR